MRGKTRLALRMWRSLLRQTLNNFSSLVERFAILFIELRDGLCQPGAFRVLRAVPHSCASGSEGDVDLASIGGVRAALDEAALFECSDGGAHRLRLDAFGAGEVGGRGGAFDVQ